MKKTIVSCFCTDESGSGNPAAIIEEFIGDDVAKQKLATELNLPVTVFVEKKSGEYLFRFFYPACEMPLCIHGALAAADVIMKAISFKNLSAVTQQGQQLKFIFNNSIVQLEIDSGKILSEKISHQDVKQMLRINTDVFFDEALPFCVASIGSPKLLVPLKEYDLLAYLDPDFEYIKEWSLKNNINGLYVYTRDIDGKMGDFVARGFNPKGGSNEDAATGVAAGALYTALNLSEGKEIHIFQGEFINRPSRLVVANQAGKLLIGGKVL